MTEQFSLLDENFVELVNCLNKYSMNSLFSQQSTEAQELLLFCAQKLSGNEELVNTFIKQHGQYFVVRDMESMAQYPPQYGIAALKEKSPIDYDALAKE